MKGIAFPLIVAVGLLTAVTATAQTGKPPDGELLLVRLIGLGEHYNKLFTKSATTDGMVIVGFTGAAGNPATLTRQFDQSRQNVISYSWVPEQPAVKQLTRQKIVASCGKPDKETKTAVVYRRVTVTFDPKGQVAEISIDYDK